MHKILFSFALAGWIRSVLLLYLPVDLFEDFFEDLYAAGLLEDLFDLIDFTDLLERSRLPFVPLLRDLMDLLLLLLARRRGCLSFGA